MMLTLDSGASTIELTVAGDAVEGTAVAKIRAGSLWLQEHTTPGVLTD